MSAIWQREFRMFPQSPLLTKEIRLLRPAFYAALLLAVAPVWFMGRYFPGLARGESLEFATVPLWLGGLLLALSVFGREFGLNTFPLLLAQPLNRSRVWQTKVFVAVCGLLLTFVAADLSFALWQANYSEYQVTSWVLRNGGWTGLAVTLLVLLASGLWTTLLLRQLVAAFWVALLVPLLILALVSGRGGSTEAIELAQGAYALIALWWARRHFLRAQEAAWDGGEVDFLPSYSRRSGNRTNHRSFSPFRALCGKELRSQATGLLGTAGLFLVHLGIAVARRFLPSGPENNDVRLVLEAFGGIWFLVPVFTACLSVAEERRSGTWAAELCLPIPAWQHFVIKLGSTLLLNGVVSGALFLIAETLGNGAGSGGMFLKPQGLPELLLVLSAFMVLAFFGFYASTLARNWMQAIAISFAAFGLLLAGYGLAFVLCEVMGMDHWQDSLLVLLYWPLAGGAGLLLAGANFREPAEPHRRWFQNLAGLLVVVLLSSGITIGAFYRIWDKLTPLEPAHGAARFNLPTRNLLTAKGDHLAVTCPNGRLWLDRVAYFKSGQSITWFGQSTGFEHPGEWQGSRGPHFLEYSNWVSVVHLNQIVAMRSDGSLWLSAAPGGTNPPPALAVAPRLERYGEGNDGQLAVRCSLGHASNTGLLLLKTNGTLWWWSQDRASLTNGLQATSPGPLSIKSDWVDICVNAGLVVGLDKAGKAWDLGTIQMNVRYAAQYPSTASESHLENARMPIIDGQAWCVSTSEGFGIHRDGSLWQLAGLNDLAPSGGTRKDDQHAIQISAEHDWLALAGGDRNLVGLKTDGTLWQWDIIPDQQAVAWRVSGKPRRLGSHADWVGLGDCGWGIVTLAADGGIWDWSGLENGASRRATTDGLSLLEPSRKPKLIENIFERP